MFDKLSDLEFELYPPMLLLNAGILSVTRLMQDLLLQDAKQYCHPLIQVKDLIKK